MHKDLNSVLKEGKIYGHIHCFEEHFKKNKLYGIVYISLMTERMLKRDIEYFEAINNNKEYIGEYYPCFFEYIGVVDTIKQINMCMCNNQHEEKWFEVSLEESENTQDVVINKGFLIYSASPIERRSYTLVIRNKVLSKRIKKEFDDYKHATDKMLALKSVYKMRTIETPSEMKSVLSKIFKNSLVSLHSTVYSVGRGNAININFEVNNNIEKNKNKSVWFDIGCGLWSEDETDKVKENFDSFKDKDANAIFISHWHMDHIIAVGYFDPLKIYDKNVYWIVPSISDCKNVSAGAYRLFAYLIRNVSLCVVPETLGGYIGSFGKLKVWKGDGSGKNSNNNLGLLLSYRDVLFCGDCEYEHMPEKLLKDQKWRIIVAPHHGAKQESGYDLIKGKKGAIAIYSVGSVVSYPKKKFVKEMAKQGFTEHLNTRINGNIEFSYKKLVYIKISQD